MGESILTFLGDLNGDSWEDWCNRCYKIRYQKEHYTVIPAVHGGDGGIEGFTTSGVVTQCYYPERQYSDDELYEHMRNKMTRDVRKLTDTSYRNKLKDMGVPPIREWHFVIPENRDSRIIAHAETKRKEIQKLKKEKPEQYDHIHKSFRILIKTAEDYKIELTTLCRNSLITISLDKAIDRIEITDWSKCDSDKTKNIRRKVCAVRGGKFDKDAESLSNEFILGYMEGLEILNLMQIQIPEVYGDIMKLVHTNQKEVRMKTAMNTNRAMNYSLFVDQMDQFEKKLEKQCPYLAVDAILRLKHDIVCGWLADCSMEFWGGET